MKLHASITPEIAAWIAGQKIFFVASAPLAASGHVNVSPKGGEAFRILGPLDVAYQDYTGSGAETAAHVRENGRIVIMFCAFEGGPKIVRLHGMARVVTPEMDDFPGLSVPFPQNPGARAIFHVRVERVSDSCGYAVPFFDFRGPRETLDKWAAQQGPDQMTAYRRQKNRTSIDGLPAFDQE